MIWILVALCVAASFVFAGIEAGLFSVSRVRLHHFARQRNRAALKLERLLQRPERVLITALIMTNLLNVFAVVLSTREIVSIFGRDGYLISLAAWMPVYIIALQLLPKAIFRRFPYRGLAAVASIMQVADLLLSPIIVLGSGLLHLIYPGKKRSEKRLFVAREDVKYFTSESARDGELSSLERGMIHNVVDFRHVQAEALMVPIDRVATIAAEAPVSELLELSRHRRIDYAPIESPDGKIDTVVDVFEVLMSVGAASKPVRVFARSLPRFSAGETASHVIRRLRTSRTGLAAVTDATGRTLGIVSARHIVRRMITSPGAAEPEIPAIR